MTHASLFSGIGGAELAASWVGWENAFHCEINPFSRKVLEYHFPNSISYDDITTTDFTPWQGKIDILTGGFPCQPFSVAGKRRGAEDYRYLWPEMLRAIKEIRPTWVVAENVNGILTMVQPGEEIDVGRSDTLFEENYITREEQEFTIERICSDLESEGYSVQPIVIPACAVGAPHRRDRVWLVANRADARTESVQQGGQDRICEPPTASHTVVNRWKRRREQKCKTRKNQEAEWSNIHRTTSRFGRVQPLPHAHGTGKQGKCEQRPRKIEFDGRDSTYLQARWAEFPTQSPICSRDDGISDRLDTRTISFPKWRRESIKAYGNAWVPQVAYEIFQAIQTIIRRN